MICAYVLAYARTIRTAKVCKKTENGKRKTENFSFLHKKRLLEPSRPNNLELLCNIDILIVLGTSQRLENQTRVIIVCSIEIIQYYILFAEA